MYINELFLAIGILSYFREKKSNGGESDCTSMIPRAAIFDMFKSYGVMTDKENQCITSTYTVPPMISWINQFANYTCEC